MRGSMKDIFVVSDKNAKQYSRAHTCKMRKGMIYYVCKFTHNKHTLTYDCINRKFLEDNTRNC